MAAPDLPTPAQVAEAVTALGAEFIARGEAASLYDINDGSCEDFAMELVHRLGGERDGIEVWWGDNLTVDGDGDEWDVALVESLWPACKPTHGLSWDDARLAIPRHAWIEVDGRHYDAECPQGTPNLFELPLVRRIMEEIAAERQHGPAMAP